MRRKARIVIGGVLLAAGAWTVVPGLIHPISTDAVVNAEVVTLRAPVDGTLGGRGPAIGDRVWAGQEVARVRALRPDIGRRDQLHLELVAARRLAEALQEEERQLAAMEERLARGSRAYGAAQRQRLTLAEAEAKAYLAAARASHRRAQGELERKRQLLDRGVVSEAAVEAALAAEREAAAEMAALAAESRRVTGERAALSRGVFVGDGAVPYAEQRRDEVAIKRAARRIDAAQAEVKVAEMTRLLEEEKASLARLKESKMAAPVQGVVWQRFAAEGDGVRTGDPVMGVVDCEALFLTAVVPKRFFNELKSGDRARVRLLGGSATVPAEVQSVRAAGGSQANGSVAVIPAAREGQDVVVTLALNGTGLGSRSDNLCQVGQRASVTFQVPGLGPLVEMIAAPARQIGNLMAGGEDRGGPAS